MITLCLVSTDKETDEWLVFDKSDTSIKVTGFGREQAISKFVEVHAQSVLAIEQIGR